MESRLSRLEAVQTVLLEIGQRSSTCSDISEFLQAVHAALGRIMYAANFYVALSDRDDGLVRFPYFVDEFDAAPDPDEGVRLASAAQSPTAWVIVNRKQLVMTADDDAMRAIGGGAWGGGTAAEHWIGCPLLDQQHQVLGAIVIQSYDAQHRFSLEDQALFALIATHVSSALQGMQSMDRLEKAVQERTALLAHEVAERRRAENLQHALYEIANLSAQASDATTLYARLHAIISELVTAKNFLIALYHPDNKDITIPYFVDEKDAQAPVKRFHYGIGMSSYVLARRQACLLDASSYAALVASGEMDEPLGNVGIASWMGAPMLLGDRKYGVIIVQSYDTSVVYGQAELDVLAFMASHVAVAMARIQADNAMRQAKEALEEQNAALNSALSALQEAQSELVRQEKLASLGRLVAGVAHEINTPLGICVTATSHLVQELKLTREDLEGGQLDEDGLRQFFDIIDQTLRIMTTNTQRAARWCAASSRWPWTSRRTNCAALICVNTSMKSCCRCSPSSRASRSRWTSIARPRCSCAAIRAPFRRSSRTWWSIHSCMALRKANRARSRSACGRPARCWNSTTATTAWAWTAPPWASCSTPSSRPSGARAAAAWARISSTTW